MYAATGDRKYIGYLDEEWAKTSDLLYDKQEHLYARDADYLTKTEANGKKMFWSRGNGWVMGGHCEDAGVSAEGRSGAGEVCDSVEGDGGAGGFAAGAGWAVAGWNARSGELF